MWGLWEGIKTKPQHNFKMKPINLHKPRKKLINAIWNQNGAWTSCSAKLGRRAKLNAG
jgi:hypothetical protein